MLLYCHSTSRRIELMFIDYLKELIEDFEVYKDLFPLVDKDYAVVPLDKEKLSLLDHKFIYSVFVAFDFVRPRPGYVYWRIPSFFTLEKLKQKFEEFLTQYELLKDLTEQELLMKGDYRRPAVKPKKVRKERKQRRRKNKKVSNLEAGGMEIENGEASKRDEYYLMGEDDDFLDIQSGSESPKKEVDKRKMKLDELNQNLAELDLEDGEDENNSNMQNMGDSVELSVEPEEKKPAGKSRLKKLSKLSKISENK